MMQRTARMGEYGPGSPDKRYRYTLGRQWRGGDTPKLMAWIMLNPSKADANIDDRTVKRCMATAGAMGYDGILVANLFAFRATDPEEMFRATDPVGPENDAAILEVAESAEMRVAAWGVPKSRYGKHRVEDVLTLLGGYRLHAVALSKDGCPRHPLYLPLPMNPLPWKIGEV